MSFSANKTARDIVAAALIDLPLAEVSAETGVTLKELRKVYRHTRDSRPVTPCAIVGQVRGDLDDNGALHSTVQLTVMVVVSGSDPDKLDTLMDGYLMAVVRRFTHFYGDGYKFDATSFAADEPSPWDDTTLLQTGAVNVTATIIESP